MKKIFQLAILAAILGFASCTRDKIKGEGPTTSELRNVTGFTAVSAAGSSNVFITKGPAFSVEVRGYTNLLPYYETKVSGGTLTLGFDDVNVRNDNIVVYITMPELSGVRTAGSGNIEVIGNFPATALFEAGIAGSGNIDISQGTADRFVTNISGSGDIYALDFIAKKAELTTSGSGDTEITATEQLKVRISGSGNVYYKGSPTIDVNISGSGAVIPR